jgi:hypothetical protein
MRQSARRRRDRLARNLRPSPCHPNKRLIRELALVAEQELPGAPQSSTQASDVAAANTRNRAMPQAVMRHAPTAVIASCAAFAD